MFFERRAVFIKACLVHIPFDSSQGLYQDVSERESLLKRMTLLLETIRGAASRGIPEG